MVSNFFIENLTVIINLEYWRLTLTAYKKVYIKEILDLHTKYWTYIVANVLLTFFNFSKFHEQIFENYSRGGSRTAATSKVELFVIIEAVKYHHKELHLGCCNSPRSASV